MVDKFKLISKLSFGVGSRRLLFYLFIVISTISIIFSPIVAAISNADIHSIVTNTPFYDPNACDGTTTTGSGNSSVFAFGDSLLVRAQSGGLVEKLKTKGYTDVNIDAQVSRFIYQGGQATPSHPSSSGLEAVTNNSDKINSAGTIIIVLGTNYDGNFDHGVVELMTKIRSINANARVFWVNIANTNNPSAANGANRSLANHSTDQNANFTVIDWHGVVYGSNGANSSLLDSSGYHQSMPKGVNTYISIILDKVGEYTGTNNSAGNKLYVLGGSQLANLRDKADFGAKLSTKNWDPVLYGEPGWDIGEGQVATRNHHADDAKNANKIVVMLGINDWQKTDAVFKDELTSLHEYFLSLNPNANIYWMNMVKYFSQSGSLEAASIVRKNTILESYAHSHNIKIIDWKNESSASDYDRSDGIHPNRTPGMDHQMNFIISNIGSAPNPSSTSGSGTGGSSGGSAPIKGTESEKNAAKLWNFLTSKGLTAEQAAGLLGNIQAESGFNPAEEYPAPNTSDYAHGPAYGLVQWMGSRQVKLHTLAQKNGVKDSDMDTQMDFIWVELNGDYKTSVYMPLKATRTVEAATGVVLYSYEAPCTEGTPACDSQLSMRSRFAQHWFDKFSGYAGSESTEDCSGPSTDIGAPNIIKMFDGASVRTMDQGPMPHPDIFVIHFTQSAAAEGMALPDYFKSTGEGLGIQFQIGPTGKIYEFFPMDNMRETYHVVATNSHAVGVEITGADGMQLIQNDAQFKAVVSLSKYVCDYYHMQCSDPKGDITNTPAAQSRGLLGHDEAPMGGHVDPDVKEPGNINICTNRPFTDSDRHDASTHAYMIKLRRALGYTKFTEGSAGCASGGSVSRLLGS